MITTKKISMGAYDSILVADQKAFRISAQVDNTNVSADENGRKIIKAGTPVGNTSNKILEKRDTVLTTSVENSPEAQGIIYADVDVTDGNNTASLIIEGVIDILKIDETTRAKITETVKTSLPKITFFKGRAD